MGRVAVVEVKLLAAADTFLQEPAATVPFGDDDGAEQYLLEPDSLTAEAETNPKIAKCQACIEALVGFDAPKAAIENGRTWLYGRAANSDQVCTRT